MVSGHLPGGGCRRPPRCLQLFSVQLTSHPSMLGGYHPPSFYICIYVLFRLVRVAVPPSASVKFSCSINKGLFPEISYGSMSDSNNSRCCRATNLVGIMQTTSVGVTRPPSAPCCFPPKPASLWEQRLHHPTHPPLGRLFRAGRVIYLGAAAAAPPGVFNCFLFN